MEPDGIDAAFIGSIPELYEAYMVPLIFEPYAIDIARRAAAMHPKHVLEIAAGTGVVTRELANSLDEDVSIVSTDLNQAMLDQAEAIGVTRPVTWLQADAMHLPFRDESFDLVICQFGAMFFPDKARAFAEARRVLTPGGSFLFNVWDEIGANEFADVVTRSLEPLFPDDPPRFLARTPHGYYDLNVIAKDLADGGFMASARMTTVAARSVATSPRIPAFAYCHGTPLCGEILQAGASRLAEATDRAESAISAQFGSGTVDGKIQAHVVVIER